MVHILGTLLPEKQLVKFALTHFYGIGHQTAARICARAQIHDRCKIRGLTSPQITTLTAFLSSPSTAPTLPSFPLATLDYVPPRPLGAELRREIRDNIAHLRNIGSYVGRRHAQGFPVRGQRTHSNAKTARKLNRVVRYS
ncbi:mitochondrial 30S ribosomal protein S13 [Fomitopsis serialis]|uniref:mitochondrial 30S ribosomal protein S13 n=1 Tax=Fomitopsis serialis TaxID=139415 RepID=UPI002007EC02|nr:mitochondrial 30S ribosomal protein S13 [Neoantrodia serialis]KAH9934722.1 mitochondrial 30S ribosomal protein S13 [Neoantrodia serialis]